MARISYQRQVQANNLPNVEVSNAPARYIAAAGESMARGLSDIGSALGGIAAKEQEKANVAAQMEIENQLSGLENETLHAPETGLLNTQGKDAIGAGQKFAETWGSRESEIISRAPRQIQQWAKQRAADRRLDGERMLMRHSTQEGDKYYAGQANGVIANAEHTATLNYLDPDRVEKEAARAMIAAEQLANLTGADETSRRMMSITAASKVNRAVLERIIAEDPDAALTRLERVRDQMTGDDLTRIESVLRPVLIDSGFDSWLNSQTMGGPERASEAPVEGAAQSMAEVDAVARASVARTVGLESGGVATAKNPASSAQGAAQFIDGTWFAMLAKNRPDLLGGLTPAQLKAMPKSDPRRQAIVAHKNNPQLSREMAEAYAVQNARFLHDSGVPVTEQTVYLAHHFGPEGARTILRAPSDTPINRLVSPDAYAANSYLRDKKTGQPKTVGQVIANHEKRAGESPTATNSSRTQLGNGLNPPASVGGKRDWVELERRAQSIPNPLVRDRYIQRLRSEASLESRREAEQDKQLSEQMLTAINANPNAPLRSVLSPDVYAKAARDGKLPQLENYRENMAQGGMIQDDFPTVERLGRLAAMDPQAFMRENIAGMSDKLSTASLTRFMDMQRSGTAKAGKVDDWATDEQRLDRVFRMVGVNDESDAAGKDSGKKNAPRERHRGELRVMWMNAVERYTKQQGKRPEGKDADEIAAAVARDYAETTRADGTTRMQRNDQRIKDKRPTIGEDIATYRRSLAPSEDQKQQNRAVIRGRYRAKYGKEPSAAYLDAAMKAMESVQ